MAVPADLPAVEVRLRAILAPYEDRLEHATVYGIPVLRRPGANAHQWFAFVKPATKHVGFYLLPVHEWPDLRDSMSPELRKRLGGRSAFTFKAIDQVEMADLEVLVARAFERYMAEAR
jgi:hypothetical protein